VYSGNFLIQAEVDTYDVTRLQLAINPFGFEWKLAAGQSWHEHHSVHPIFVQVLKGEVIFHVKDRDITLVPGKPIHVTAKLLHSLRAVKDSTLLVTMLTGESHPEPKVNIDVEEV